MENMKARMALSEKIWSGGNFEGTPVGGIVILGTVVYGYGDGVSTVDMTSGEDGEMILG